MFHNYLALGVAILVIKAIITYLFGRILNVGNISHFENFTGKSGAKRYIFYAIFYL